MDRNMDAIFSPLVINGQTMKNRLAVAPMTRVTATADGRATETMTRYYERFPRGGFGTVITEGIYIDQAHSQGYLNQPGLADDAQASAWKPLVNGVRSHGALAIAQLMHAGALSQGNRFRASTLAPSPIQPRGEQMAFYHGRGRYAVPAAMTDADIADAIAAFAEAAQRALAIAGFSGVEIHGANGYLLDQFLTAHTNQRTDRWGGSTLNRLGLMLETLKAVRVRVGRAALVGVRIAQGKVNDFHHKWSEGERDAEIIFGGLADAGADYIHVTEHEAWKPAFSAQGPSLTRLARRYAPKAVIFANGGLHEIERAVAALDDGADVVTLARGALANPDLPRRWRERRDLNAFDPALLGPIASIKDAELAM